MMISESWQEIVAKKKSSSPPFPQEWIINQDVLLELTNEPMASVIQAPARSGVLSPEDIEITERYTATELLARLASQRVSSKTVTTAFCKRAAVAHQLVNCLTETFFDRAIERAEYLDEYLAKNGTPVGPLHGLPISVKDCFDLKGVPSTLGYVSFIKNGPATENSALVNLLLDLGAVLYVKTNMPQTMMTADTHNNVFGRTLNPYNRLLTAGGSSGGEGALVALRGALIGVGTDIAGSVRVPALCCGIYGFKPTLDRIPYAGQTNPAREGLTGIYCAAGPLTAHAEDLDTFFKAICNADPWRFDETVVSAPWRTVEAPTSLRLGLISEDKKHPLHPPTLRTVSEAAEKLKAAGHVVMDLHDYPSLSDINTRSFQYFAMDPAGTAFQHVSSSGEPRIPSIAISLLPEAQWLPPTLENLINLNAKRAQDKAKFRQVMVDNQLDAIIMPGNAGPASEHDTYGLPPYTVYINYLNHPACVLPYGVANENLDKPYERNVEYVPAYHPKIIEGAPCSLQVVGKPLRDEELLEAVKLISKTLQDVGK